MTVCPRQFGDKRNHVRSTSTPSCNLFERRDAARGRSPAPRLTEGLMIHTHASLASACATGQQSIVEFLVNMEDTDLDALDADGTSPLCAAVTWDFDPIVRLLVDAGCDVNVRNTGTQTTALHVAAIQENGRIAHRLLQAGADPTLQDIFGRSSCDFASPSASTWPLFAARGLVRTPKDELIRKGVIRKVAQVEAGGSGGGGGGGSGSGGGGSGSGVRLPSGAVPFYSRPGSAYVVADADRPPRTSSTAQLPSLSECGVDPLGEMEDEPVDTSSRDRQARQPMFSSWGP